MDVAVSIGHDTDERAVTAHISDDSGWSPDLLEMAITRVAVHAVWVWRELHPETATATDLTL